MQQQTQQAQEGLLPKIINWGTEVVIHRRTVNQEQIWWITNMQT